MPENTSNEVAQSMSFDAIKISLASPERIKEWATRHGELGEVKKPETINYRTLKPETDGLFCERIFGPVKDWECHCGKYKKIRYKNMICDRCGVEVTKSSVRRERMGCICLAAPVSHIWYFKGIPSRMGLILDMSPKELEKVLYFAKYVVLDPNTADENPEKFGSIDGKSDPVTGLAYKQTLTETEYEKHVRDAGAAALIKEIGSEAASDMEKTEPHNYQFRIRELGTHAFKAQMGAEAVRQLLMDIDLEDLSKRLKKKLETATAQQKLKIVKRLEVVEAFRESGNKPEWMILTVIPVIPPDLRPMVQLDGGRFATSDLNDLYRRIINRNNRLKRLLELGAPDIIVRNEKRMLQEAVDALIDNGRRGRPVTGPGNRALKSLSDMLKGKSGRFRQNLLGKRVDYSGRSVIVVGPEMKIYQCGVPKEMAIELFKPFVMKELVARKISHNIKNAKKMVERLEPGVWDVLEDVIKDHPVMLNRAPTLHRLGIQAFEPILVEGKALKLHPLVCAGFNADFDGDQMAIHVPLTVEAQAECRFLMLSPNNFLKPSDGGMVPVPSQDMVLGIYYLTQERPGSIGEGMVFKNLNEARLAYENKYISLQSRIKVRMSRKMPDGRVVTDLVESTFGRFLYNEVIPQDLGFVDRSIPGNELKLEVDRLVKKKDQKKVLERVINIHGATKTAEVLDNVKAMGYGYSTRACISISISDMTVPKEKTELLTKAQKAVDKINMKFRRGLSTDTERYRAVVDTWKKTDDELTHDLLDGLDKYNNIFMMADSGARGSDKQIKQLAGMRGLMADTTGHTIELPIKSNFREGLDVLEYFMSAHGARKGLSDTALRTADSGYLTRRMVVVSQDLVIRELDCCEGRKEIPGRYITKFAYGKEMIESLQERITGRYAAETICDKDGNVLVKANHMITPARAEKIMSEGVDAEGKPITRVKIRSILTCRSRIGICAKCYGSNMATGEPVQVGEPVGIIAAQSIGEPGTQLTMRTFHTGGVAGGDITQGLPRVEELFEARRPKGMAIISDISGKIHFSENDKKTEIIVTNDETGESKTYLKPFGTEIKHKDDGTYLQEGDYVEAGDQLIEGSVNPHDLMKIKGVDAVQNYLLREVQRVYRLQGVEISDKHIEVLVRQMMKKVRVVDQGDSQMLPGTLIDGLELDAVNEKLRERGLKEATSSQVLLGITKASLATESFLSAASFQETTKVLTDAAIKGKVDHLVGPMENVIIGKLIPAGTGMKRYRSVKLDTSEVDIPEGELVSENMDLPDMLETTDQDDSISLEDTPAEENSGSVDQE